MPNDVLEKWKNLNGNIYPGDKEVLDGSSKHCLYCKTLEDYQKDPLFGDPKDYRFHLGLPPYPFAGDLEHATVIALLLNPGFVLGNYITENMLTYQEEFKRNLVQDHQNNEYPFYQINPKICFQAGYDYWIKRLNPLIDEIQKRGYSRLDAQKLIAKKFATIELVPYHSLHFKAPKSLWDKLASKQDIKKYVEDKILPKAIKGDIMLFIRSAQLWEITNDKYSQRNIIIFQNKMKKDKDSIEIDEKENDNEYNGSNRGFNLTLNTLKKKTFNLLIEYILQK